MFMNFLNIFLILNHLQSIKTSTKKIFISSRPLALSYLSVAN